MLLKILFLSSVFVNLFAMEELQENYFTPTNEIRLSTIISNVKHDSKLLSITQGRYTKRVKTKELLSLLKAHGYTNYTSNSRFIKFTKQSQIDVTQIKKSLQKLYEEKYKDIQITKIEVVPRGYLKSMPTKYSVKIQSKSHLKSSGVISIKSDSNKQIFFNYKISATLSVFKARIAIKRNSELSHINAVKESIILDKFRAMPLQEVEKVRLQSKRNIKAGTILTSRDTQALLLVKRGSNISIVLNRNNMAISFSATALENGLYGETIKAKKSNNKIIKVKIIAKNRGEVI